MAETHEERLRRLANEHLAILGKPKTLFENDRIKKTVDDATREWQAILALSNKEPIDLDKLETRINALQGWVREIEESQALPVPIPITLPSWRSWIAALFVVGIGIALPFLWQNKSDEKPVGAETLQHTSYALWAIGVATTLLVAVFGWKYRRHIRKPLSYLGRKTWNGASRIKGWVWPYLKFAAGKMRSPYHKLKAVVLAQPILVRISLYTVIVLSVTALIYLMAGDTMTSALLGVTAFIITTLFLIPTSEACGDCMIGVWHGSCWVGRKVKPLGGILKRSAKWLWAKKPRNPLKGWGWKHTVVSVIVGLAISGWLWPSIFAFDFGWNFGTWALIVTCSVLVILSVLTWWFSDKKQPTTQAGTAAAGATTTAAGATTTQWKRSTKFAIGSSITALATLVTLGFVFGWWARSGEWSYETWNKYPQYQPLAGLLTLLFIVAIIVAVGGWWRGALKFVGTLTVLTIVTALIMWVTQWPVWKGSPAQPQAVTAPKPAVQKVAIDEWDTTAPVGRPGKPKKFVGGFRGTVETDGPVYIYHNGELLMEKGEPVIYRPGGKLKLPIGTRELAFASATDREVKAWGKMRPK